MELIPKIDMTPKQVKYRKERNKEICEMRLNGDSLRKIGFKFNLSSSRVAEITKKLNYKRPLVKYICKWCGREYTNTQKDKINGSSIEFCSFTCRENQKNKWSYKYSKCRACGTTEKKHKGHGYCEKCLDRKKKKEGETRQRRFYIKNRDRILKKLKNGRVVNKLK